MDFVFTNNADFIEKNNNKNIFMHNLINNNILLVNEKSKVKIKSVNDKRIFIFGDLIAPADCNDDDFLNETFYEFNIQKLKELCGIFYLIVEEKDRISIINSIFSLLPLYYLINNTGYIITSGIESIKKYTDVQLNINYKFLLEKILFNYSFYNRTAYNQILLADSNSYIEIDGKINIKKHLNINEYYVDNPKPWKKSLNDISDIFIERVGNYLPDSPYYSSFTGGFDGRALIACGLFYKKVFTTFSYGAETDSDVSIPRYITDKININYEPIILDDNYSKELFIKNAELFVNTNSLNGSISRSHYAWMTDILNKKTDYILSGNFGSEIIRTMKVPGVMTSETLFDLFSDIDNKSFIDKIKESGKLGYFNPGFINKYLNEIIEELVDFRENYHKNLNQNQRFYIYLFEEVFRKYFGPEIYYEYYDGLYNRCPFLDFKFIKELLKTNLAGVNARYKEENPFMRYKGQILYAHIINKTYPELGKYLSDKNYKPENFLSLYGNMMIFVNYFKKKIKNQYILKIDKNYTPYNYRNLLLNNDYFIEILKNNDFYNNDFIKEKLTSSDDALFHILSCILYFNK